MSAGKERVFSRFTRLMAFLLLIWWPGSHWLYPQSYHAWMGFKTFDLNFVHIIGTCGVLPVLLLLFLAAHPQRNRDMLWALILFSLLFAATFLYLVLAGLFPKAEWINVVLLLGSSGFLALLYPWENTR